MWKNLLIELRKWERSFLDFIFPRYCTCCAKRLALEECFICTECLIKMPLSKHSSFYDNEMARIFWGLIPIQKATSYFLYTKSSLYTKILFELKYHNKPEIGIFMGRIMARDLIQKEFFEGIDFIVPLPLSRQKEKARGYNQSEWIAYGISEITGIKIDIGCIIRTISNPSQTSLSHTERRENTRNIFKVEKPEKLNGRHILLVDDVITTGSTLLSCAEAIAQECNTSISILTLAQAHLP